MTPFGNEDTIDKRYRERIRELETRNHQLESELRRLANDFSRSTYLTLAEKEQTIRMARRVLRREVANAPT